MKRAALVLLSDTNNERTQPVAIAKANECNYRQVATLAFPSAMLPEMYQRTAAGIQRHRASRVIIAWEIDMEAGVIDIPAKIFADMMKFFVVVGPSVWSKPNIDPSRMRGVFHGTAKPESKRSWEPEPHA